MPAMVRNQISRFEALARRIVEGSAGRLIGNDGLALKVAAQLTKTLEDNLRRSDPASAYRIAVNPLDLRSMGTQVAELEVRLGRHINSLARNSAPSKSSRAVVRLIPDETVRSGEVAIEAIFGRVAGDTTNLLSQDIGNKVEELRLLDAFLIVNGRRHVALDKPLIKVGRRIDNDVIVDVPVVSRQHAHIRWRHGRFIIYDLGSRGGVQINGERVIESVLTPGDLITLSERVPLIYGEGLESRKSLPDSNNGTQDTLAYTPEDG